MKCDPRALSSLYSAALPRRLIERVYGHVLRDRDRCGRRSDTVRYEVAKVLPLAARNA